MTYRIGPGSGRLLIALACVAALAAPALAAEETKARAVAVVPFDATALPHDQQWKGEAVAQILMLGFVQHPAIALVDPARLRAVARTDVWGEAVAAEAARSLRAAVVFGQLAPVSAGLEIRPRLLELTGSAAVDLAPIAVPPGEFLARVGAVPFAYVPALKVSLDEAERRRMERATRPTRSLRAFALFARGQTAARRGGPEGNESAVDLLGRAIEADPSFTVAHYTLGTLHQALGNRWKAAAQFRASTQLDPTYPEPYKSLGDLFLAAPRRLFDQAVEAYTKAIELRPFYADAHVGLGDAKSAQGDIDGAVGAYQKALAFNSLNPRVHMSLGKIYYMEKGLYYEAVGAFERALELDPNAVEARMGLGEVYEDKGLYKEAIEEYRRVIELEPRHTNAMYNLAVAYEKVDPREAIVQWERYITVASQLPSEKDWVDLARQHLRRLRGQLKD
jgi:tetratricopeptide (TPR) repeat protein